MGKLLKDLSKIILEHFKKTEKILKSLGLKKNTIKICCHCGRCKCEHCHPHEADNEPMASKDVPPRRGKYFLEAFRIFRN